MPAGTVIAEAAGSSRSVDLQTCTPSKEYEDQVGLPDAAMSDSGLVDIERLSTVSDLTDSEREVRCRDLLESLKPPGHREDRAKRMSISAGTIVADAAGSSRSADLETRIPLNAWQDQVALPHAAPGVRRRDLLSRPLRDHENEAERRTRARKR